MIEPVIEDILSHDIFNEISKIVESTMPKITYNTNIECHLDRDKIIFQKIFHFREHTICELKSLTST
jgi:hypothetical protein